MERDAVFPQEAGSPPLFHSYGKTFIQYFFRLPYYVFRESPPSFLWPLHSISTNLSRSVNRFISKNSGSISKALGEAKNLVRASSANRNQITKKKRSPKRDSFLFHVSNFAVTAGTTCLLRIPSRSSKKCGGRNPHTRNGTLRPFRLSPP